MKNVIGTPARGESFFSRTQIIQDIIDLLETSNLQIAAPRRIGKTSILFHLLDNKVHDYVYVYVDTEAIDDENEFFKKVIKEIFRSEEIKQSGTFKRLLQQGHKFLKRVKSISVLGHEVEFTDGGDSINYKEDLVNLLMSLELDNKAGLIILLDEFPQTVQNIIEKEKGDMAAARRFLQSNREIRLHPDVLPRVKFIVTGSIGLNHTVAAIESSAFINDLASVEVGPLSRKEANDFLRRLLSAKTLRISDEAAAFLFERLEWLIPFHIQLAVQELISLARAAGQQEITADLINQAFDAIIQARNNNHFEHYYSRLKKQFKNIQLDFVLEVLNLLAEKGTASRGELYDISTKYQLQSHWRQIIDVLVYDGYINNIGDHNTYRFNSPVVRMWWHKFICK